VSQPHSDALVFFGATGDLAYKKIFQPATPIPEPQVAPLSPSPATPKNLLIGQIASRTEEHQRIGMRLTHAFSP